MSKRVTQFSRSIFFLPLILRLHSAGSDSRANRRVTCAPSIVHWNLVRRIARTRDRAIALISACTRVRTMERPVTRIPPPRASSNSN